MIRTLLGRLMAELLADGDGSTKDLGWGLTSIREKAWLVVDEDGIPQLVLA
jgi:hypothetical protein